MIINLSKDECEFFDLFLKEKVIVKKQMTISDTISININDDVALVIRDLLGDEITNYIYTNYTPSKTAILIESLIDKLYPR